MLSFQHRHCRRSVAGVLLPSRDTIVNMLTSNSVISPPARRAYVRENRRCSRESMPFQIGKPSRLAANWSRLKITSVRGSIKVASCWSAPTACPGPGQKVARSGTAPRRLALTAESSRRLK